jgi:hypothetical protein
MKRTLITILAVILTSLPAFAQTKVTGEKIVNSTINSSTIDSTPIGSTSRSSVSATWMLYSGSAPNPIPGNSVEFGWNATSLGEADFIDDYGTGAGGFNWYAVGGGGASHAWNASSPIMKLDRLGNLTATKFIGSVSGNVIGNVSGNASTATSLAANPPNCDTWQAMYGIDAAGNPGCGPHIQATSTSSCTTPAGSYSTCPVSGTFPHAFTGAYSLSCQLAGASDPRAAVGTIVSQGSQTFTVNLVTEGSLAVSASMQCVGVSNN